VAEGLVRTVPDDTDGADGSLSAGVGAAWARELVVARLLVLE
jgi:hypothetical protein